MWRVYCHHLGLSKRFTNTYHCTSTICLAKWLFHYQYTDTSFKTTFSLLLYCDLRTLTYNLKLFQLLKPVNQATRSNLSTLWLVLIKLGCGTSIEGGCKAHASNQQPLLITTAKRRHNQIITGSEISV